jgi:acyl-CoA reductase-like NAD-dependent aldehyde dehydrogenase
MTIGGRTVTGNDRSGVEDPAVGEHFADAPVGTPGDLDQACEAAAAAGPSWSALGEDERRAALMACGTALAARADEVARLLTGEQGKPLRDARAEIALAARWFADTAEVSPTTPATLLMGELLGAVLPPGVLNTVNGGLELGPALAVLRQL